MPRLVESMGHPLQFISLLSLGALIETLDTLFLAMPLLWAEFVLPVQWVKNTRIITPGCRGWLLHSQQAACRLVFQRCGVPIHNANDALAPHTES